MAAVDELNAHFALHACHRDGKHLQGLILNFEGTHIRASNLGAVERTWISRVNVSRKLQSLAIRKYMGMEDYEVIVTQLFPVELDDILSPEHYEIVVSGLGIESIITSSEAKSLVGLGLSRDEFKQGALWTGAIPHHQLGHNRPKPSAVAILHIPKPPCRSLNLFPDRDAQPDLYPYLRVLVEAAVYDQKYWQGYFFTNAKSTLSSYHEANQLDTKGLPTPPHLTEYKRPWTNREVRLLQRGRLICKLLQSFEEGEVTDFGIIRAIRASYVGLPGQGYWDAEELSTYLYHRIAGSGLSVSKIPEILAMHPEHDKDFASAPLRAYILRNLRERAELFEQEEQQRLREMETSITTFELLKKKEMTRWQRIKLSWKKWSGKEEMLEPFDPFAAEHGVDIPLDI